MLKIDFHHHVNNRLVYACQVAQTLLRRHLTVAFWTRDRNRLAELDHLLWTIDPNTFLPHAFCDAPIADDTPILLSTQLDQLHADVLVLLDDHLPDQWERIFPRYQRIIDIVSVDEKELRLSRARYRAYKRSGIELAAYDRRH